jgi:acyl-lipid omega-6 desaturase (Delta-12 desaturase)
VTNILEKPLVQPINQSVVSELKLSELRKMIPAESLKPPSVKNFVGFIVKLSLFFATFYAAMVAHSLLQTVLWTVLSGVFLFSLGTVGHDCGHGSYIRPRWLNEAIGQLCIVLHGMVYFGWKHSHNTHHANTNRGDLDPDRLWLYSDEYLAMNSVARFFWRLFHTKCFWLSAVGHYFRSMLPWPFQIESKTDKLEDIKTARRDITVFFAVLTVFHAGFYFAGFGFKSLPVHFLSILVGFACLSVYVRTEHFLLTNSWDAHEKPWLTSRTVLQNPILDFLATNLNYHVEHHVLQTIPHANLPALRPMIKRAIIESKQPYHEDTLWNFLKIAFTKEFFVIERDTFKEIPLHKLGAA